MSDMELKPFRTLEEQADLILSRGCLGDKKTVMEKLSFVNYYRLSAYLYPYRKIDSDTGLRSDDFIDGTDFTEIWNTYRFDRRLRMILLDAIERFEIALRTRIAYCWANANPGKFQSNPQNNPDAFASAFLAPNARGTSSRDEFLAEVQRNYNRSNADCANHHKAKGFFSVKDLPVWVFVEFAMFGNLATLFRKGLPLPVRRAITSSFGLSDPKKLSSVISLLGEVRNNCAHHSRVWNASWTYKPKNSATPQPIAPSLPDLGALKSSKIDKAKTAYILLLCDFLVGKIAPDSRWKNRLRSLFEEIPLTPFNIRQMGIDEIRFREWLDR